MKQKLLAGLLILNIATWGFGNTIIQQVAEWGTGPYVDVAVSGDVAYCAAETAGLDILDISDPGNPAFIGKIKINATVGNVLISGTHLLVGTESVGEAAPCIYVYDISDPAAPAFTDVTQVIERVASIGRITKLVVQGNTVYCCYRYEFDTDGLAVLSLNSETHSLTRSGSVDLWGFAYDICVKGDYVYAANLTWGLQVVDVSTPESPVIIQTHEGDYLNTVAVDPDSNLLFATGYDSGDRNVRVYSLTNPEDPSELGRLNVGFDPIAALVTGPDSLVIGGTHEVVMVDTSDEAEPVITAQDEICSHDVNVYYNGMAVSGNNLFVAFGLKGLRHYDISLAPDTLTLDGSYDHSISPNQVYAYGGNIFVFCHQEGILSFSTQGKSLVPVSFVPMEDYFYISTAWENILIVGTNNTEFTLYDMTDPSNIAQLSTYSTAHNYSEITAMNGILYLVGTGFFEAADISNPTAPAHLMTITYADTIHSIANDGTNICMLDDEDILQVLQPGATAGSLELVGTVDTGTSGGGELTAVDGRVYLAWMLGLYTYNISDPSDPKFECRISTQGNPRSSAVMGDLAALADGSAGLRLVDLSAPEGLRSAGGVAGATLFTCFIDQQTVAATDRSGKIGAYSLEQGVYIPHIDWSSEWSSYLIADNTSDAQVDLTIETYGETKSTSEVSVDPGQSLQVPLTLGSCAKVTYSGSGVFLKESFVNNRQYGIAEFELTGATYTELEYVLPHYLSDTLTWMGLAVFNPWNQEVSTTMEAYSAEGELLATTEIAVPPMQRLVGYVETFFPELTYGDVARIRVLSSQGLCGLNISGQHNEKLLFTPASRNRSNYLVAIPHIASEWDYWNNRILIDCVHDTGAFVNLYLYKDGEQVVAESLIAQANQTLEIDLNAYRELDPQCGYISFSRDVAVVRQSYEFISTKGTAEFLLSWNVNPELVFNFPSYAEEELTWMGMGIMNTGNSPDTVTLTAYRDGVAVGQTAVDIPADDRKAFLLGDLFPEAAPDGIDRIIAAGSERMTGINISGSNQDRYLFTPAFQLTN